MEKIFTVRDIVSTMIRPYSVHVRIDQDSYELISEVTGELDERMMAAFGDYISDGFEVRPTNELERNRYDIMVKMVPQRPMTMEDLHMDQPQSLHVIGGGQQ